MINTVYYVVMDAMSMVEDWRFVGALLLHVALAVVLVYGYRVFSARVRGGALVIAIGAFIATLAVGVLVGWGLLSAFPGTVARENVLAWALAQVAGIGYGDASMYVGEPPEWVTTVLTSFASIALVVAVVVLLRSRRTAAGLSPVDDRALRALLDVYGEADSLSYFATRADKSVIFSPDGRAAIAYRVEMSVCLAAGDPVGDRDSWDDAITAWLDAAAAFGWIPAVVGASKDGATAYRRHDMSVLALGDEAIIDTRTFSLRGPQMAPVRQAVTRATRAGATVRIRTSREIPELELARLRELADTWRAGEDERGFSMALGRLGDAADPDCVIVEALMPAAPEAGGATDVSTPIPDSATGESGTAREESEDPGERVVAILSFVPWGRSGLSLDVMRRSPQAPSGTFELMVSDVCRHSDELGIRRISLNFAMFRAAFEAGEQLGAGPVARMWRGVLRFLSRWWQLESLYKANEKYDPAWSPRMLCFSDTRFLPQIGVVVGVAEGFLGNGPRRRRSWWGSRGTVPSNAPQEPVALEVAPVVRPRPEQVRVRLAKADRLAAQGVEPWPVAVPPTHTIDEVRAALTALEAEPISAVQGPGAEVQAPGSTVHIAGRLLAIRDFGGVVFGVLRDWTGDVQVIWERERSGADDLAALRAAIDLGDLIAVRGRLGASRSGEPSVLVDSWTLEAKCLHPMPDKRRGLTDPEARVRQRHVEVAVNPAMRARLAARSAVVRSLRETLHAQGYLEVETPILQTIHGGANARPFQTHINAYDLDLYLRIAPELYLKRLCVGGMSKVFELGRTFRNEGVDFSHNPEFTILEAYEAYEAYEAHGDYLTMMRLCRELIQNAAIAATGSCQVPGPGGELVDISGEWPVVTLFDAVSRALVERGGHPVDAGASVEELRAMCDLADVPWQSGWDAGATALEMYEHLVEGQTTRPTFYTDFPVSVSPLTRSHRRDAGVTERWDLVAWGVELGTAYSELTDPIEQRKRLTAQSESASRGDPEAMELDEEFLAALEYGMPPTGGLGIGVDRVVMLVTGASIRETLPFPMAKPR